MALPPSPFFGELFLPVRSWHEASPAFTLLGAAVFEHREQLLQVGSAVSVEKGGMDQIECVGISAADEQPPEAASANAQKCFILLLLVHCK